MVLNPLDARCPFWSPANEIERNAEAVTIAAIALSTDEHEREGRVLLSDSGADIFTSPKRPAQLPTNSRHGWRTRPNYSGLWPEPRWRTTSIGRLARRPPAFFHRWLLWRRACGFLPRQDDAPYLWNATDWAQERKGWIFVTSKNTEREVLRPLHSLWIDILVMRLLKRPKPGQKKVCGSSSTSWRVCSVSRSCIPPSPRAGNRRIRSCSDVQGKAQLEEHLRSPCRGHAFATGHQNLHANGRAEGR